MCISGSGVPGEGDASAKAPGMLEGTEGATGLERRSEWGRLEGGQMAQGTSPLL